jgi:glycosyltransferase involved in cell wall biosynthesis
MNQISSYILTKNSEKYLSGILDELVKISDEIFIVDSGSVDKTEGIAKSYENIKFYYNEFENFKDQRIFAEKLCSYDMILFVDSDEFPDYEFIQSVEQIKKNGFVHDAYKVTRYWNVLGKNVHAIYPITSPDHPIRLYNRNTTTLNYSQLVHETPTGFTSLGTINGSLTHFTFETQNEIKRKLKLYTNIAARELIIKRKRINLFKIIFSPIAAFIKWYFIKQGYKDGITGIILGKYAFEYTLLKYLKGKYLLIKNKLH